PGDPAEGKGGPGPPAAAGGPEGRRAPGRRPARAEGASHRRGRALLPAAPPRGSHAPGALPVAPAGPGRDVLGDDRGALAAAAGTVTSAVGRHAPRRERLRAGELVPRRLPRAR